MKPGTAVIALSLRIDRDDGTMKGFITTILSRGPPRAILGGQDDPAGSTRGLYDRKLQPIVTDQEGRRRRREIPVPDALARASPAGRESDGRRIPRGR